MIERIQEKVQWFTSQFSSGGGKLRIAVMETNPSITDIAGKGVVGFTGAVTATTINTWIGIIAGLLTCVYMGFQIEAAWRKRKKERDE